MTNGYEIPSDWARTASPENGEEMNDDEHEHGDLETLPNAEYSEEIHNGDLYIVSNVANYVMDKIVEGNVFIFGHNVTIEGKINGSLFVCATGTLEMHNEAYVTCHIFACADTINISGQISDVYAVGREVNINDGAFIYRDMKAVANTIYLSGAIERDAVLFAETIKVPEDINKLHIHGNLKYEAKERIENFDENVVHGETTFKELKSHTQNPVIEYVLDAIGTIVFDLVLYICLLFFASKFIKKAKEYVSTRGLLTFALGLAFTVLVPIIAFILLITNIGAPLALLAILIYLTMLMINTFIVTTVATEFVASKLNLSEDKLKKGLLLIPVSLVIWALKQIPFIGSWISVIVFLCGIGVVILYQFDRIRNKETTSK